MLGCLSLDIICSLLLIDFLKLHSRNTVLYPEQIMSMDKDASIFLPQMEAIVYSYKAKIFLCVLHRIP